ncbi:TIGR03086 family metal-binding protein [Nocardioides sp.]|uniref:TIGR03086 family metal-binding protein n=1 Tax=Nocardioides sp. TaxID=35761 RepID=UPI003528EC75
MTLPAEPASRHRAVAGRFAEVARQVGDWDARSPVPEWTAREVVGHLLEWLGGFLSGSAGVELAARSLDDPVSAWEQRAADVQALLDDPTTADRALSNPHTGDLPLAEAIDRFYTTDVLLHTWDLARAAGGSDPLDPDVAEELLAGLTGVEEVLRSSGQYGPAVPAPDDASPGDRLMAFLGRDPLWAPPR